MTAFVADRHLQSQGIIARRFAVPDFEDKLRFTVGLDWEMEKTAIALGDFMAG